MAEPPCIRERTQQAMLAVIIIGIVLAWVALGVWLVRMALHFNGAMP